VASQAGDVPANAGSSWRDDAIVGVERLGRLAEGIAALSAWLFARRRSGGPRNSGLSSDRPPRRVSYSQNIRRGEEVLGQVLLLAGHLEIVERASLSVEIGTSKT
jgi:hypothetical protein